jgi:hypothetical protein
MLKKDVVVGETYIALVSGKKTTVKIKEENEFGGWNAVNVETNREVRIRTAGRLTPIEK